MEFQVRPNNTSARRDSISRWSFKFALTTLARAEIQSRFSRWSFKFTLTTLARTEIQSRFSRWSFKFALTTLARAEIPSGFSRWSFKFALTTLARAEIIRLHPMEFQVRPNDAGARRDRGRERRLVSAPPPSEPDWRF